MADRPQSTTGAGNPIAGELGAADAERDMRGFALKFHTEEGTWDLSGNNTQKS